MAEIGKQYSTFKDAYCAVHRCAPERFEQHVFWKCVFRQTLPLVWVFYLTKRDLFHPDVEAIESIGAASSLSELQLLIDEFENRHLVERSLRRRILRVRMSSFRLDRTFRSLAASLRPPEPVPVQLPKARPEAPRPASPRPAGGVSTGESASEPREVRDGGPLIVRRLRRLHAEVVAGRPVEQASINAGIPPAELKAALAENKAGFADLVWLDEHLSLREEVLRLRVENDRLNRVTADLSTRLLAATGRV
jgi:hypothetical protein